RGTTDTSECGSALPKQFPVDGYPGLDKVFCLRMNFPLIGTVPINTCLLETGPVTSPSFSQSPCYAANVFVTGRTYIYDDPLFCGRDASTWWHSYGYPNLGFTTCTRPLH